MPSASIKMKEKEAIKKNAKKLNSTKPGLNTQSSFNKPQIQRRDLQHQHSMKENDHDQLSFDDIDYDNVFGTKKQIARTPPKDTTKMTQQEYEKTWFEQQEKIQQEKNSIGQLKSRQGDCDDISDDAALPQKSEDHFQVLDDTINTYKSNNSSVSNGMVSQSMQFNNPSTLSNLYNNNENLNAFSVIPTLGNIKKVQGPDSSRLPTSSRGVKYHADTGSNAIQ